MKNRIISLLLLVVMMMGAISAPISVLAAGGAENYPLNSIVIKIEDIVTHKMLGGARFEIYYNNSAQSGGYGTLVATVDSDSSGVIVISGLPSGYYIVRQTMPSNNYHLSINNEQHAYIKPDGTSIVELVFSNYRYGGLAVILNDKDTGKPIPGATFSVTDVDNKAVGNHADGIYTTDSRGEFYLENLPAGDYKVTQLTAAQGYAMDSSPSTRTLRLQHTNADQSVFLAQFSNSPLGTLLVCLRDSVSKGPLSGAVFNVKLSGGADLGNFTTGTNGSFTLPSIARGTYIISQVSAPNGYLLATETKSQYVNYVNTYAVDFENQPKSGLYITIYDADTKTPLKDAKFQIYQNSTSIGTYTTNMDGVIHVPNLDPGWYTVSEIAAPEGYILDDTPKSVQIIAETLHRMEFENQRLASLVIIKTDEFTGDPLAGARFRITTQSGEFVADVSTDGSGNALVPYVAPGWYVISETKAPTGYIISEAARTVQVKAAVPTVVTITNQAENNLQIVKLDYFTRAPLAGATFRVEKANGEFVGSFLTDSTGKILVGNLKEGTYVVSEVKAPNGYQLDTQPQNIVVQGGKLHSIEFLNKPLSGIEIIKLDSVTNNPLAGATFVVERSNGERIGTYKTDAAGKIIVHDLNEGTYIVSETIAPNGYELNETPKTVVVVSGKLAPVEFRNNPLTAIEIVKIDSVSRLPLAGATFKVERPNGEIIGTYKTDSSGKALVTGLVQGTYIVSETVAPDGYILHETPKTVTVTTGKVTQVEFTNKPLSGIQIIKTDSATNNPLTNATFKVQRPNGELIGTYKTDAAGKAIISDLAEGTYIVSETIAPNGYVLNETPKTVTVVSGKLAIVEFANDPYGSLVIKKTDEITGAPLAGAKFTVTEQGNGGLVIGEDYVTGVDGSVTLSNLKPGWYVVKETKAPDGYHLDNTATRTVEVKSQVPTTVTFANRPYSGIQIIKTDSVSNAPLKGAVFTVQKSNGDKVGDKYTTDIAGKIIIPNLPEGAYIITEIEAPAEYVLDALPQTVEVKSGKLTIAEFTNTPYPYLHIVKTDASTGQLVSGAEFVVTNSKGEVIANVISQASGAVSLKVAPGVYTVTEVKAPAGYELNDPVQTVEVKANGSAVYYGTSIVYPNNTAAFANRPLNAIQILKLDSVTHNPLSKALFTVEKSNGERIGSFLTDSAGSVLISGLTEGTYIIKELSAPAGYQLDETPKSISISGGRTVDVAFTNKPLSGIQITKLDAVTLMPLKDASFTVTKANGEKVGTFRTAADGTVVIPNLEEGSYIVSEITAPTGYQLDETPKNVNVVSGRLATVEFKNKPFSGIQIIKTDAVTNAPLANATFTVDRSNGERIGIYKTDAAGKILIPDLAEGTYIISETAAPNGYMLDNTPKTVTVVSGRITTVEFTNKPHSGIQIIKTDAVTNAPLANATFTVDRSNGERIGIYKTNAAGQILVSDLAEGTYIISETAAPNGYMLDSTPKTVTVVSGRVTSVEFTNAPYGSLVLKKTDEITGRPLAGAHFTVTHQGGSAVGDYITDNDGSIVVPNLKQGWYVVSETKAPNGYHLDSAAKTIEIKSHVPTSITFTNRAFSGIEIVKLDAVNHRPLQGAAFTVTKSNGERVGTFRTEADGKVLIPNLAEGVYVVGEITAPDGYQLDETPKNVTVKSDQLATVEFTNKPFSGIQIIKTDAVSHQPLSGATFEVKRANGEKVGTYKTDVSGKAVISDLTEGTYIVSEIIAPDNYILDNTPQTVTVVTGKLTTVDFVNKPFSGIEIRKVDAVNGNALPGAVFEVRKQNGEYVTEVTTDIGGKASIANVQPGWYVLTETKAPQGYAIDGTAKTVEVKSGAPTVVTFSNKPHSGIEIIKLDAKTNAPLSGATFTVERDNGEKIGTYKTDMSGKIIVPNLTEGTYIVSETIAPDGYTLDEAPKTVIVKSGKLTSVEFRNKPHSGIEIIKLDAVTRVPLMGAAFTVERDNGEKIGTYRTDRTGKIIVPDLPEGTYIVSETDAPNGYVIDEAPKTVIVKSGKLTSVEFTNRPLSGIQIIKLNAQTNAPLPGATFVVERANGEKIGTFKTDSTGKILVPALTDGTYIVSETIAPDGFILDEAPKTVTVTSGKLTTVEFLNKPLAGLRIQKLDSASRQPIAGVEFNIAKMSGERVENDFRGHTFTTDRAGQIFIPSLADGYYIVTEVKAANGYILDSQPQTVLVQSGKTTVLEVFNTPQSGLLIVKTDAVTGKPMAGVVFDVRKADGSLVAGSILDGNQPNTANNSPNSTTSANGNIPGSYTTDANGRILINGLAAGQYHVTERKTLDGYELDTDVHSVTVVPGQLATLQLTNTPKAGLRIIKIDSVTKKPIYGVEFMLFDANNKVVGTYQTDNNGVIDFTGIIPEGRYTIRETKAAAGYYLDEMPKTVEFVKGKVTEIRWENTPQMAQIQITKKSGDDNEVNGLPSGTPLAGAVFEAYDYKTGNLVDRFVSGNDGRAVSKPLPLGRYVVKEVQAPQWYKLSTQTLDIDLEFATQIVRHEFLNYSANTGVRIRKTGNNEAMSGDVIRYDIREVKNTSTVPLTDFYWRDVLPVDAVRLTKIVTGTYNQSLKYKIIATTNKGETRVIADNLSTTQNNVIDCSNASLGLKNDEFVTSFTLVFGTVKAGFMQVEQPQVFVKVQPNLPNGYQFSNKCDIGGKYGNEWVVGNSTWLTTIYAKGGTLPRTGY